MTVIQAQLVGDNAVVPRAALEHLVAIARKGEEIGLEFESDVLSGDEMTHRADAGGSFECWNESGEDIYTIEDGKAAGPLRPTLASRS